MRYRRVDLRSDTITLPTPAMRQAMAAAEVGDDVFGEDPTVRRLEELAAGRLGKEAGLFVTSGTMANLVCQLTHCGRGDEMVLGDQAHIFYYEQGGSAALGSIHPRTVPNQPDGKILLEDIEAAIRPDNVHFPRTRLIVLENTHNRCYGSPLETAYLQSVRQLATRCGLKVHVDGARLFNAAAALGVTAAELAAPADSIGICLSKGLAAPVGSVVCGTRSFIDRARRARKILGGGMRQAGVLAAAGIVALTEMTARLPEDHATARRLAEGLAASRGIAIDLDRVTTNIVFFDSTHAGLPADRLSAALAAEGVHVLSTGKRRLRAVTHYHITAGDIDYALKVFDKVTASSEPAPSKP
ncbi:MAG: low-specificity L-threonine aldolase [Deltaproteobacteria bacterium]|nr:low-specificity L-threonine aldolase [Deltaproteobacteria bacterium]